MLDLSWAAGEGYSLRLAGRWLLMVFFLDKSIPLCTDIPKGRLTWGGNVIWVSNIDAIRGHVICVINIAPWVDRDAVLEVLRSKSWEWQGHAFNYFQNGWLGVNCWFYANTYRDKGDVCDPKCVSASWKLTDADADDTSILQVESL